MYRKFLPAAAASLFCWIEAPALAIEHHGVATEFGNYRTLGQCHWNVTVS